MSRAIPAALSFVPLVGRSGRVVLVSGLLCALFNAKRAAICMLPQLVQASLLSSLLNKFAQNYLGKSLKNKLVI